jgi:glycosyltransferase involved in cell wall biosynthesis
MPLNNYGIYLSWAPGVDLRHEGLGRYLAAFLKGAASKENIRFVIVCPSWSKEPLEDLFVSESVPRDLFEVLAPDSIPLALRLYESYSASKKKRKSVNFSKLILAQYYRGKYALSNYIESRILAVNTYLGLIGMVLEFGLLFLVFVPIFLLSGPFLILIGLGAAAQKISYKFLHKYKRFFARLYRLKAAVSSPKDDNFVLRLYKGMEKLESERMLSIIESLNDVKAWYSPTAFWPAFNKITKPRLMCVPDVVLTDFPIGFSGIGGDRLLQNFANLNSSIRDGQHYVTYSEHVKRHTLVDLYSVNASNVSVIHHAPNDLHHIVEINGFSDPNAASIHYCKTLLKSAFSKSAHKEYMAGFSNLEVDYIFYASQFRPNKNVITLLRAYEYLLRKKYISHKLVLTGSYQYQDVQNFIRKNFLENDVICLYGLTLPELAACYKLASLAVNPSLSEGGCPFTFTEALSVGTPVVMARIPVTEEVLNNVELQEVTLFDPYDWKDLADKVEWALANTDTLLSLQVPYYEQLSTRTWDDVVDEHVRILESISVSSSTGEK